ncbi:MAG TPA: helix-turn-helix domain-containing protein [Candidatus Angelobacter sp.]
MEVSGHEADILRCLDEGMSFDEIAQELDMTSEQVYQIGTAFFDRAFAIWIKAKM